MKNFLYSRKIKNLLRILSLVAVVVLLISNIFTLLSFIFQYTDKSKFYCMTSIALNSFVIIFFILLIIHPEKIGFISLACILYDFMIYFFEEINPMGCLMYILAMIILYVRGFFERKRKVKIIICVCSFLILSCLRLRFGISVFINSFIEDMGYTLVFFFAFFFLASYLFRNKDNEKILNIAKFPELKENDAEMLRRVLANQQYKVIAIDLKQKEGSVRNRLNKVYDILGVEDKIGFITSYKGFEVSYVPEPEEDVNEVSDAVESSETEKVDL